MSMNSLRGLFLIGRQFRPRSNGFSRWTDCKHKSTYVPNAEFTVQQPDSTLLFGGRNLKLTESLAFLRPDKWDSIPVYRVMDKMGYIINEKDHQHLDRELILRMYKTMALLRMIDDTLMGSAKEGDISIYVPHQGEEAVHVGAGAGLDFRDLVFSSYRETGVLFWRGMEPEAFMDQCFSNVGDVNKGRQIPTFYGSSELNCVTISPPLGTQMPQASGAAYAFKQADKGLCVFCFFGDGTASLGDTHVALNFASTLQVPIVFMCRNNGVAISTSIEEQYNGDGIAARGIGYGMPTIRVFGNDVLAVSSATRAAREIAVTNNTAVLIEAITYRTGGHTSNIGSDCYQNEEEMRYWEERDPIVQIRYFLRNQGWWTTQDDEKWRKETQDTLNDCLGRVSQRKKPNIECMFTDVYDELTPQLQHQMKAMKDHVEQYSHQYPVHEFQQWK